MSQQFCNLVTCNRHKLYFNREADAEGLANWIAQLEAGTSLEEIVNGFAASAEFKAIVNGLKE